MTKNRDRNEDILFADINFKTPTSKPSVTSKPTKQKRSRFRWIFLIVIAGITFGGAITVTWYSYMRGYDKASDEFAPHIASDDTPFKMKPDEPGGMKIPHQNRHVYDMITTPENRERKIEHLLPPPEMPLIAQLEENKTMEPAEEPLETEQSSEMQTHLEPILPTHEEKTVESITPSAVPQKTEIEPVEDVNKKSFDERLALLIPEIKPQPIENKPFAPQNIAQPIQALPTPTKLPQENAGNFRLQLAAVKTSQEAQKEINRLKKNYPEIFKNCALIAKNVDLGPKGIFYRIQTTSMSKEEAERLTEMLKKLKQACFVVKP